MAINIENPDLTQWLISSMILFAFIASVGIYFIILGAPDTGALAIITALIFPAIIMSRKYFLRPKSMDFNDEGIVFQFPLRRLWTARWGKISEIFSYQGDPKNAVGSPNFGIIKVKGRIAQIELTFEATKMIRDEYFKRYGTEVNKIWVERKAHRNH